MEREINFFGSVNRPQAAGDAAQIRIKVPNAGQVFRFSKVLIQENEPMTLDAYHIHGLIVKTVKGLLFLGVLLLLFRARAVFLRALSALHATVDRHPKELGWLKTPRGQTLALFGAGIWLSFFSRSLAVLAFFAGIFSAVRWLRDYLGREKNHL